ncbi:LuxR family two component transcriptional regulator [Thermosporothrix hazakensis]|jgi:DNA-binding NarL/FixJ family response regulator|uniref:LuxR family two component transcriptional regulator n=1 Tax=Thermosporothrix hazakensis TaxID=644383 RepID=A0A326U479_THEHA|nr:response regulator transcription factor [Thermosporothrix hazakensis]PZW25691.1 LuxR family two component transcriptional regulator [Thermosporothrix hazakensis]GCE48186.1 DNA-binding response regulator [Thermosporothrix hazakensis]
MVRIVLADDHPIVREGLRAVLETQEDLEVVAECSRGDEVLRTAMDLRPDIILLDLEMPVMDGVETIRRLRQAPHNFKILVFTAFDNDERIIAAIQAGADGYLLKGSPRDEIFKAIHLAMEGGSLLQPVVASKLLRHIGQQTKPVARGDDSIPPIEELTERELEVLHLLAQGMPNKEIASQLVISERTAKFHVSSIMSKLGATNRTEAVAIAAQRGLINLRNNQPS